MSEETDLAWFGGFFDGEGSITIGNTKICSGWVTICNSRLELLRRCVSIATDLGIAPPNEQRVNRSVALNWCGYDGTKLLTALLPYIRHPKQKRRAEIYLKFYVPERKYKGQGERRGKLLEEWKELDHQLEIEVLEQELHVETVKRERMLTPQSLTKKKSFLEEGK